MGKRRACRVCAHPEVDRINAARAAGVPLEALASKYGIPKSTIFDHWQHVPAEEKLTFLVGKSALEDLRARAVEENASALDYISIVRSGLMKVFKFHVESNSAVGTATVAGRLLAAIQEAGRITGEIERVATPSTTVNVITGAAPGFSALMAGLVEISRNHPGARADILALVDSLTGSTASLPRPVATIEHHPHA
jgi:hypothetical protein